MKQSFISLRNIKTSVPDAVKLIRLAPKLPDHLHNLVIGCLLGDAGCYRTTKSLNSNSRLEFSFGQHRLQCAQWIMSQLSDYVQTGVKTLLVNSVKGGPANNTSFRLKTVSLPVFNYYRDLFYH